MQSRLCQTLLLAALYLGGRCAVAGEMSETAFSRLDRNGDGYIEASDMAAMRERMFHRLDRNQDGQVTREEVAPANPGVQVSPNALPWPDQDGDGRISLAEFMSQEPALIVRGDRDGDHRVSAQEFRELVAARR
ncbi:Ca2+-binding EF-hand superfamily protein [Pseudomonas nitritireducens]|uniref:Ca2+-binding EF-hand superfamily protein n=1 Tax=Pseudomonas nitroreducens TaxID=46680 RepID=A0A7W7P310_PSENT|nr:EF-hand domain-containing protein [Pseudomonas nitritireducens]MBB4865040.1 Ca2+-binding EF-hand superfamily protein [Pseudomonas nitritireducens]